MLQDGLRELPIPGRARDWLRQVMMPAAGLDALAGLQDWVLL